MKFIHTIARPLAASLAGGEFARLGPTPGLDQHNPILTEPACVEYQPERIAKGHAAANEEHDTGFKIARDKEHHS